MGDLSWGVQITVLGMGLVFGLLAVLWGLLVLVQRWDTQPDTQAPDAGDEALAPGADVADADTGLPAAAAAPVRVEGMDPQLVAAITIATLQYRALRRREAAPEMRIYWPGSLLYASRWVGAGRSRQNNSWQRRGK